MRVLLLLAARAVLSSPAAPEAPRRRWWRVGRPASPAAAVETESEAERRHVELELELEARISDTTQLLKDKEVHTSVFRVMRKTAAGMTGVHGYFSQKDKLNALMVEVEELQAKSEMYRAHLVDYSALCDKLRDRAGRRQARAEANPLAHIPSDAYVAAYVDAHMTSGLKVNYTAEMEASEEHHQGGLHWGETTLLRVASTLEDMMEDVETQLYRAAAKAVMKGLIAPVAHLVDLRILEHKFRIGSGEWGDLEAAAAAAARSDARGGHEFPLLDACVDRLAMTTRRNSIVARAFPLPLERALLRNAVSLCACLVRGFSESFRMGAIGHGLSVQFKPMELSEHLLDAIEGVDEASVVAASRAIIAKDAPKDAAKQNTVSRLLREHITQLVVRLVLAIVSEAAELLTVDFAGVSVRGHGIAAVPA